MNTNVVAMQQNTPNSAEQLSLSEENVVEFLNFLSEKESYLDTGLGAFHTDDHGNW